MNNRVYFIQYLRPNGRRTRTFIECPPPVVTKADFILRHKFRFEIEQLTTGQIHMTISDEHADYAYAICNNNEEVPANVNHMILSFDVPKALKHRKLVLEEIG